MPRPTPRLLASLLVMAGLTLLAWWLPNRPQAGDVSMPEARFNSVSFAPFRAGQSPLTDTFPTAAQVDEDLARIAGSTRAIRTYAAIEGNYDVAALARAHGLKLWQGIWLGADRAQNAREIARAIANANRYPDTVTRVVVGNEVLLRRDLPPAELIADIEQVRAAIHQPVTYADVWEFWEQFPELAAHVDIVTIHILPYWEDIPTGIDRAIAHVDTIYQTISRLFPGKPIAIGETGWPSRGRWRRDAAPGLVNQVVYLRRFIALAAARHFDYNLIEAFDQIWKYKSEGTVGANWGLWTASRLPKFPLTGPVSENPDWPEGAAFAIVLALFLFTAGTASAAAPAAPRLAIIAFFTGNALAYAWAATTPDLYDLHLRLAASANLTGQAILAFLLQSRATTLLAGRPVTPNRTGAQAAATIRTLILGRLTIFRTWQTWLFADLAFLFVWTAAVLQLLLVFDPRYRDFPLPTFAVPLVAVPIRRLLRDQPRHGGREELAVGATLLLGALASLVIEGPRNLQSLTWNTAALVLAAPLLLSLARRAAPATPTPPAPPRACPTSHCS